MGDGIYGMLSRDEMCEGAKKYWDFYNMKPGAGFYQREFGFYSLEKWRERDGLDESADLNKLFGFDPEGRAELFGLGWCEAGFQPVFETKVLEDRGDYELVQDFAGRSVLCFKGRRDGFMPEYVDHPVKDMKTWEEGCLWRMNPDTPARNAEMAEYLPKVVEKARQGMFVGQSLVGGYMYLRSLRSFCTCSTTAPSWCMRACGHGLSLPIPSRSATSGRYASTRCLSRRISAITTVL